MVCSRVLGQYAGYVQEVGLRRAYQTLPQHGSDWVVRVAYRAHLGAGFAHHVFFEPSELFYPAELGCEREES